ncbi:hypothetical protein CH063_07991 [Colletotrichum higginsianum]|uniref:Uncharacterized protein n=1 Tax=Colletotrichum higginsianum (strain IMI 349063) TaxID=759273 RepID=H1V856_COLHI|nr:hypothetical protein CH063_07991 [Colletotrichum higginsianum]
MVEFHNQLRVKNFQRADATLKQEMENDLLANDVDKAIARYLLGKFGGIVICATVLDNMVSKSEGTALYKNKINDHTLGGHSCNEIRLREYTHRSHTLRISDLGRFKNLLSGNVDAT